ncbi:glycine-rich protein-like isoform X2 [Benincasa hispida]|uniref:glycine-rich protein-like isoform X2 n=1 Tax=Benincasa hispida TaxID=102211 RepID=UPI001901B885|nr:glycine-rich protein-like isoform X2 [Benincasa hispida]
MSSKAFIFLGLLFAIVVLFSSEEVTVMARDVKFEAMMETGEVDDVERHGFGGGHARNLAECLHGCNHGCCECFRGRCIRCCSFAGEAVDVKPQAKPNN